MDDLNVLKRGRDLNPVDAAINTTRRIADPVLEFPRRDHQIELRDGLHKVEVFLSGPTISGLRHRTDVAEQRWEAALDRSVQIVLLGIAQRAQVGLSFDKEGMIAVPGES